MRKAVAVGFEMPRIVLADLDFGSVFTALLDVGGDEFKGSAQVVDGATAPAAARAVLAALDGITPPHVELDLAWLDVCDPGAEFPTVVTVIAAMRVEGSPSMPYVGSAFEREGIEWAAARAVLAAVSRRIQVMLFA